MKRAISRIVGVCLVCAGCGGGGGEGRDVLPGDPGAGDPGPADATGGDPGDAAADDAFGERDAVPADPGPADDGPPPVDPRCASVRMNRSNPIQVDDVSRQFWLHGPGAATGPGGKWPVVFLWHGFNAVMINDGIDLAALQFSNLLAPEVGNAAYPFLLVTPMADGVAALDWNILDVYDGDDNPDVRLFDEVLGLLDACYGVDPDRIHSLGFSAGAIMTDLLGVTRGDRMASLLTWSGGYIANPANDTGEFDVIWPGPGPSSGWTQVVVRGGSKDIWVSPFVTINFDDWTRNDLSWLNGQGHDVIACWHTRGHQVPMNWGMDYVLDFFRTHPRGTVDSPYRSGLPESFPTDCAFHGRAAE